MQLQLEEARDRNSPPTFRIDSKGWWVKVLGMLEHNWALIEKNSDGTATAYFFHDRGLTKRFPLGFKLHHLKGLCAIVDSLDFENEDRARYELEFNGFEELSKLTGSWEGEEPSGPFYDARSTEDGIYSRGAFWKKVP